MNKSGDWCVIFLCNQFFFVHLSYLMNVIWTSNCKHNSVSLYSHAPVSTTETDKELIAGGEEMSNPPQPITEEDAVAENQHAEATESSDDDDDDHDHDGIDDDKENSDDRHNETDAVIIENDLEIQEL